MLRCSHLHGWRWRRRRSAASLRLIGAQSDGAVSDGCPAFRAGYPVRMLMLLHALCGPVFARTRQMELSCAGDVRRTVEPCKFEMSCICNEASLLVLQHKTLQHVRIAVDLIERVVSGEVGGEGFFFSFFCSPCDVLHDDGVGLSEAGANGWGCFTSRCQSSRHLAVH